MLALDDPLAKFIPSFHNMRVCDDRRYKFHEGMSMAELLPKLFFPHGQGQNSSRKAGHHHPGLAFPFLWHGTGHCGSVSYDEG